MQPYWIRTGSQLRLAIVPRPRGGDWLEDDIAQLRQAGVDVLVSLLTREETLELGLSQEAALCEQAGIGFRTFPVQDCSVPSSRRELQEFVSGLRDELHEGRSVAAHCRAGIGRSSLLVAAILCEEGWSADEAFSRISDARGLPVPDTEEQARWVHGFVSSSN